MNKSLILFLSCFIPSSKARKTWRAKHLAIIEHKQTAHPITAREEQEQALQRLQQEVIDIKKTLSAVYINLPIKAVGPLRRIQSINFSILCEIDRLCRKYGISYWLDSGTLLGAVRHRGFIPWDDDLDIGMMAHDYVKFQEIIKTEWAGKPFLFKKNPACIGKVMHKDFIPSSEKEWLDFVEWQEQERLFFALDIFPFYFLTENTTPSEGKLLLKNGINKKIADYQSHDRSFQGWKQVEQNMDAQQKDLIAGQKTNHIFLGLETIPRAPRIFETEDIFPLKETYFEGRKFFIPARTDKVLTEYYGNFWDIQVFHSHLNLSKLHPQDQNALSRYPTIEESQYDQSR